MQRDFIFNSDVDLLHTEPVEDATPSFGKYSMFSNNHERIQNTPQNCVRCKDKNDMETPWESWHC